MPRRLVIHAGFHKTGVGFIQQVLKLNRPVLKPHMRSNLRPAMRDPAAAALEFSATGDALDRARFHNRFGEFLYEHPPMHRRVLCISAPDLSGHMPGQPKVTTYRAAIKLAKDMADCVQLVLPQAEVVFFYTTRAPKPWLTAIWAHLVRATPLKLGLEDFTDRYAPAADLGAIVEELSAAVSARVVTAALEDDLESRFGPATPLLDICEIPEDVRAMMTRPAPSAVQPDIDLMDQLLKLNRTIRDPEKRETAKRALLAPAKSETESEA